MSRVRSWRTGGAPGPAWRQDLRRRLSAPPFLPFLGSLPPWSTTRAYSILVGTWLLGWGAGTVSAVRTLTGDLPGRELDGAGPVVAALTKVAITGGGVLVVSLAVLYFATGDRLAAVGIRWPAGRADWQAEAAVFGAGWLLTTVASAVRVQMDDRGFPRAPTVDPRNVLDALTAWTAGPTEELFFTAVIVVVLRRAGRGWAEIVAVSVVLRLLFHLYYGWGTVALTLWAAGIVAVYLLSGRLLGLVLAHAVWNVLVGVAALDASLAVPWVQLLLVLAVAVASCIVVVRAVLSWRTSLHVTGRAPADTQA